MGRSIFDLRYPRWHGNDITTAGLTFLITGLRDTAGDRSIALTTSGHGRRIT